MDAVTLDSEMGPVTEEVRVRLNELAAMLAARGFAVTVDATAWSLEVAPRQGDETLPQRYAGRRGETYISRRVGLAFDARDRLDWFWEFKPLPDTGAQAQEMDIIGPGEEVERCADTVTRRMVMGGHRHPTRRLPRRRYP